MNLRNISPALLAFAFVSVAAGAQDMELKSRTVQLNSDLTAQIMTVARDVTGFHISAVMKITNTGENTMFVAYMGDPSLVDLTDGSQFSVRDITGMAWCKQNPERLCIGVPDPRQAYPFQSYTEIGPGRSIIVTMTFNLWHTSKGSTGDHVTMAAEIIYRTGKSEAKDAELTDRERLKDVHIGNLSFDSVKVREK